MNTKATFVAGCVLLLLASTGQAQLGNRTVVKFNLSGVVIQSYTAQVEPAGGHGYAHRPLLRRAGTGAGCSF